MNAGLIWIVVGLGLGVGIALVVRRFMPSLRTRQALPSPPANRQQARKRDREAAKQRPGRRR